MKVRANKSCDALKMRWLNKRPQVMRRGSIILLSFASHLECSFYDDDHHHFLSSITTSDCHLFPWSSSSIDCSSTHKLIRFCLFQKRAKMLYLLQSGIKRWTICRMILLTARTLIFKIVSSSIHHHTKLFPLSPSTNTSSMLASLFNIWIILWLVCMLNIKEPRVVFISFPSFSILSSLFFPLFNSLAFTFSLIQKARQFLSCFFLQKRERERNFHSEN